MIDVIHLAEVAVGLLTALVALVAAWIKLRQDSKPKAYEGSTTAAQVIAGIDQKLNAEPQRTGNSNLGPGLVGVAAGGAAFLALESAHALLDAHAHAETAADGATLVGEVTNIFLSGS